MHTPTHQVLLLDDNPVVRTQMRHLLMQDPDREVVSFATAHDALDFLDSASPDLVLTDQLLRPGTGLAFIEQARRHPLCTRTRFLLMTSSTDPTLDARARHVGAEAVLRLPAPSQAIRQEVDRALRAARAAAAIAATAHGPVDPGADAPATVAAEVDLLHTYEALIRRRDPQMHRRGQRVAQGVAVLAAACGMGPDEQHRLRLAARLHDVGHTALPPELAPGRLLLAEGDWLRMQQHTGLGHALLSRHPGPLMQRAAEIAKHHHEHWDGSGYPDGLAGEAIPLAARLAAVVLRFEAFMHPPGLRMHRPVATARTGVALLAGQQLDPRLVDGLAVCADAIAAQWDGPTSPID